MNKQEKLIEKLEKAHAKYNEQYEKDLAKLKKESEIEKGEGPQVGKWYKYTQGGEKWFISPIQVVHDKYHEGSITFEYYGIRGNEWVSSRWFSNTLLALDLKPATDSEVEEALIKEAKKRGFVIGAKFISKSGRNQVISRHGMNYRPEFNCLNTSTNEFIGIDGCSIFYNGKWAEIIEDKLELNGKEIIIEDGKISIGCVEGMDLNDWETFVHILEYTGCKLTHSDIGDISLEDLKNTIK